MIETAGRRVGLGLASRGDVRDVVAYALQAEAAGFESIWIHDSYFEREPISYLAALALETKRMRIGAGALNPYTRHPVVLAETGSSLDNLAPGRISMAFGSGLPLRLAQMNIPFNDTVAHVSEAIDLIRTLWAGERLVLNDTVPPLQPMFEPPHYIPISIAGYQGRFLDLCGEKADGYLSRPMESVPAFRTMRERIRRVAQAHGRDPDAIETAGYVLALVGDTRRDALNRAKREPFVIYMVSVLSDLSLKRAGFPPALRDEIAAAWRAEDYTRAGNLIPDELLDAFLACGTVDEVAIKALEYHEAGMDVPLLQPVLQDDEQVERVLQAGVLYATDGRLTTASAAARSGTPVPDALAARPPRRIRAWRHAQAWYEIARPFSLTASVIPVAAGAGVAWAGGYFHVWFFLLTLIGAIGLQIGTNIINEIYDVRQGIDKITSPRASHALVKGALTEREAFILAFGSFGLVVLIGLALIALRGPIMLAFGIVGLVAGYGYTGPPFQYKFHALAVPLVFLLMGPIEVVGSYFAISGRFDSVALVASIPIGLLVAAILHANEWRDISEDARTGIATLSAAIGARRAHYLYMALVTGAYLTVGVAAMGHLLPISSLLVLLSLPMFISVVRAAEFGASGQVHALSMIDLKTARLHMIFGFLLAAGLALSRYLH
jgi:1,4-dihydroxy-2-naphthoate octaprenyltransferase